MKDCAFECGQPVDTDNEENYVEVASWVNGPKLDSPKLRTQTGRVAHAECVRRVEHGQAPDQPDLFDTTPPKRQSTCKEPVDGAGGYRSCNTWLDERGDCPNAIMHLDL